MVAKYDLVRLAQIRDDHAALVANYRTSTKAQHDASGVAARARMEAPKLPGAAPTRAYIPAPGIGNPVMPPAPRPRTNEFYMQPLAALLAVTPDEIEKAGINPRALSVIIVAETRLEKLKLATVTLAAQVHESAARMASIELFAAQNRL